MSHPVLTPKAVEDLAHLARLDLTAEELAILTPQLDAIVEYVALLEEVATEGVEPLAHALPVQNVFREDHPLASLPPEEALSATAQRRTTPRGDQFYAVPAVLE